MKTSCGRSAVSRRIRPKSPHARSFISSSIRGSTSLHNRSRPEPGSRACGRDAHRSLSGGPEIGPEATGIDTPAFSELAARGCRFRQAYATVPETLPSHASMMTGLYPAGHGVHENARYLSGGRPVLAERLRQAGYRTVAFVSAFTLARRFGLARGFDAYDDEMPEGQVERAAQETTDRTLAHLRQDSR